MQRRLVHAHKALLSLLLLFLLSLPQTSQSFSCNPRRRFLADAAATAAATLTVVTTGEVAHAGIDVSGLPVEQNSSSFSNNAQQTPNGANKGVPPSQLKSGPLANTKLGFQVGGGPRSEEVVRAIDEPRYDAVRKAQGLPPMFLEGVPIESNSQQAETIRSDLKNQPQDKDSKVEKAKYLDDEKQLLGLP